MVVLWKLDHLSRRLRDGVNILADWCEKGMKIVVVTQQIEINGAVGRMIAALLLGLAEIELEYRAERRRLASRWPSGKASTRNGRRGRLRASRRGPRVRGQPLLLCRRPVGR
jgi:DNA invertase Pin-like site-specific DNA recombinase